MKLGVIACLHGNIKKARKFASYFKKSKVDAIVLEGDICNDSDRYKSTKKIFTIFSKTGKRIIAFPGSHEEFLSHQKAAKRSKNKINNIIKPTKIKLLGYDIIVLPGSDWSAHGSSFRILDNKKELKKFQKKLSTWKKIIDVKVAKPIIADDIKALVTDPGKTVLLCHVPPKFSGSKSIDVADYLEATRDFKMPKKFLDVHEKLGTMTNKGGRFPYAVYKKLIKIGLPVKHRIKNVGNIHIKSLLHKLKITKYVCGHIHEAGGRAVNWKDRAVKQGKWSRELFYNCSPGIKGRAGIVEFQGELARYRNVRV